MSEKIPAEFHDLLKGPVYVSLATLMPDGQPQVNVMWCDYNDTHVLINTAKGRQKDKNMRARPQVTVLAVDPQNPFRWVEVRGKVVEVTESGAVDHIEAMAQTYAGKAYYGGLQPAEAKEKETRVLFKIEPTRVVSYS